MTGRRFACLFLLALIAPGVARAIPFPGAPVVPPVLQAGEAITITFPSLPDDADEFELLLSVDDGASYPLRLTPSLDARESTFSWTVPALPADRARLRVRWGDDGRDEVESTPSDAFAIRTTAASRLTPLYVDSGEIWIGYPPSALLDRTEFSGEDVRPEPNRWPPALASSGAILPLARRRLVVIGDSAGAPAEPRRGRATRPSPETIPLRI